MKNATLWLVLLIGLLILVILAWVLWFRTGTSEVNKTVSLQSQQGELVKEFPEFPVYPTAQIENSYVKHDGDRIGYEAKWEMPEPVSAVLKWYLERLPSEGWVLNDVPENLSIESEQFLIANKGEVAVYLTIERDGDKTEVIAEVPLH